jgi:hypothetical protein
MTKERACFGSNAQNSSKATTDSFKEPEIKVRHNGAASEFYPATVPPWALGGGLEG